MLLCDVLSRYLPNVSSSTIYTSVVRKGPSWPWPSCSWTCNYLCNQYILPLTLWVRIRPGDTTLIDKACQWLAAGPWFSLVIPVSSTNKTYPHDIFEIYWICNREPFHFLCLLFLLYSTLCFMQIHDFFVAFWNCNSNR